MRLARTYRTATRHDFAAVYRLSRKQSPFVLPTF